jgi:hypothetical protein
MLPFARRAICVPYGVPGDQRSVCWQRKWSVLSSVLPEAALLLQALVQGGSDDRKLSGHLTLANNTVFFRPLPPASLLVSSLSDLSQGT